MKDRLNNVLKWIYLKTRHIKRITKKLIRNIKIRYWEVKKWVLKKEHRKLSIGIGVALIIVSILFINIFSSNAYYHNEISVPIIRTRVGDMISNLYDYILFVYLEDADNTGYGSGNYHLGETIPLFGYTYSGYNCKNNSTLIYDDVAKSTSVTVEEKEVCSIYFNLTDGLDVSITIMIEDNYQGNTYTVSNIVPYYGYTYSHYECNNNGILEYNSSLHYVLFRGHERDFCRIYFNKDNTNNRVDLYIKSNNEYIQLNTIPIDVLYTINSNRTNCFNDGNEIVQGTVTYTNGYINVSGEGISYCEVYLDELNE